MRDPGAECAATGTPRCTHRATVAAGAVYTRQRRDANPAYRAEPQFEDSRGTRGSDARRRHAGPLGDDADHAAADGHRIAGAAITVRARSRPLRDGSPI